jgi:hypothetical protein
VRQTQGDYMNEFIRIFMPKYYEQTLGIAREVGDRSSKGDCICQSRGHLCRTGASGAGEEVLSAGSGHPRREQFCLRRTCAPQIGLTRPALAGLRPLLPLHLPRPRRRQPSGCLSAQHRRRLAGQRRRLAVHHLPCRQARRLVVVVTLTPLVRAGALVGDVRRPFSWRSRPTAHGWPPRPGRPCTSAPLAPRPTPLDRRRSSRTRRWSHRCPA